MKRKKLFVSPRVLSQVEVCLEGDLLVIGQSVEYQTDVINDGIENQDTDVESDLINALYD